MERVNEVRITGRATKDAQRFGNGPWKFAIAFGGGKKRDSEERWPTEYVDVIWFSDRGAQIRRGSEIEVVGRLKQSRWEKDGQKHSRIEITAKEITGPCFRQEEPALPPLTPKYPDIESGLTITDEDIPW